MLPTEGFASRGNPFLTTNEWGYVRNGHCTGQDYDLYLPAGPQTNLPVFVYIHGGGWCQPFDKTDHEEFFELIANDGWAVFAPDYIMQPDLVTNPDQPPRPGATMAAQLKDIDLMMHEVRRVAATRGFDVSRLVLAGESAGAHLASLYAYDAASPEVLGLSLGHPLAVKLLFNIVGFVDHTDPNASICAVRAFGPSWTPELYRSWLRALTGTEATDDDLLRYSPVRHIVPGLPPHLISYSCRAGANDDGIVPVSMYETLTNELTRAGIPYAARLFPGTCHCETMQPPATEARAWYLEELRKFRDAAVSDGKSAAVRYDSIRPGQEWLDTDGNPIQAHGGSIIVVDKTYYWYGENKSQTTGRDKIWHWGVNLYSSTDLMNWKFEGNIIPPDLRDAASPVHPHSQMDRPHILYNDRTKKFVCWLKIMGPGYTQGETILTADSIKGPWTILRVGLLPCGMNGGDFDLVKAYDGKGYYFFERPHKELICADLTADYTDVTGYYSTHFPHNAPPYVREAPAYFERQGRHYLVTSGTTGYYPNPSEVAVADTWHGPWTVLGNPHPGDTSNTSYHSQISCIFRVPGKKDLYIALGDRWLPGKMDVTYEECAAAFGSWFGEKTDPALIASYEKKDKSRPDATSKARYVWLPFTFKDGMPTLEWRDEWKPSDFE